MAEDWSGAGERTSEDIRREIRRTRAEMDETVDELGERLSPGRLVDELWARFRRGDGMSAVGEVVREHPVPLALMGIGLGWLAVERSTGSGSARRQDVEPGTWERAEGRKGPYGSDAVRHGDPDWPHTGPGAKAKAKAAEAGGRISEAVRGGAEAVTEKVRDGAEAITDRVRDLKHQASERGHDLQDGASDRMEDLRERASDAAHRAADGTRERARRTREGFWEMMEENPMVMGAIAFGVGLASGLAVPATPGENRLMGRASDTLKGEARRVAEDTADSAKRVAQDAAHAARDEAEHLRHDEQGPARSAVEDLKQAATRVVDSAKEAARESAERNDLTTDTLTDEAKGAAQRTREAVRRPGTPPRRGSDRAGRGTK